jgi:lipopolysaccharide transport system permease protein
MKLQSKYFNIIKYQVYAQLKQEASRGFLGFLWWILDPLLYMLAFYTVFALGLRGKGPDFAPFLLCGLVPWKWFASTVNRGATSILRNSSLMNQVDLPKHIFPTTTLLVNAFKFSITFCVLILFLQFFGYSINAYWLYLPVLICSQVIFLMALCLFLSAIVPFIPDLKIVIENALMFLFFVSGIFFDINNLDPEIAGIFKLNPMAIFIDSYRAIFLHSKMPEFSHIFVIDVLAIILIIISFRILTKHSKLYPKMIANQ